MNYYIVVKKNRSTWYASSVQFSHSVVSDSLRPHESQHARTPVHHQTHVHQVGDAIQPSHPLLSPSPPAPNPFQHQGLFQWVNSSHDFISFYLMLFFCLGFRPGYLMTLSSYVSLGFPGRWLFCKLSLFLMALTPLGSSGQVFCSSVWICLTFSSHVAWAYGFLWGGSQR